MLKALIFDIFSWDNIFKKKHKKDAKLQKWYGVVYKYRLLLFICFLLFLIISYYKKAF